MNLLETVLVRLEDRPFRFAWRIAMGLGIPPALRAIAGGAASLPLAMGLFFLLLAALRIGPALARFTLAFSVEAMAIWKKRRFIAKEYDSYQWEKLFWIGLGILPHSLLSQGLDWGAQAIAAFCLVGGGTGLVLWTRVGYQEDRVGA